MNANSVKLNPYHSKNTPKSAKTLKKTYTTTFLPHSIWRTAGTRFELSVSTRRSDVHDQKKPKLAEWLVNLSDGRSNRYDFPFIL